MGCLKGDRYVGHLLSQVIYKNIWDTISFYR